MLCFLLHCWLFIINYCKKLHLGLKLVHFLLLRAQRAQTGQEIRNKYFGWFSRIETTFIQTSTSLAYSAWHSLVIKKKQPPNHILPWRRLLFLSRCILRACFSLSPSHSSKSQPGLRSATNNSSIAAAAAAHKHRLSELCEWKKKKYSRKIQRERKSNLLQGCGLAAVFYHHTLPGTIRYIAFIKSYFVAGYLSTYVCMIE